MSANATRSQVMSIIGQYSGQANVIAIPRIYIAICGDYNRAAILNQILYWSERTKDKNGWFYKSYAEWSEELGLSEYQIRRAVEGDKRSKDNSQALVNLGIETTLRKDPNGTPKVHYRVDSKTFIKHLTDAIEQCKESTLNNVKNGNSTLSIVDPEQCQDSLYTETTTENTDKEEERARETSQEPTIETEKSDIDKVEALLDELLLFKGSRYKDRQLFHSDFEDYSVADWLKGIEVFKGEIERKMKEQGKDYTALPYKYLERCVSGQEVARKQAESVKLVPDNVKFVPTTPYTPPSAMDGVVTFGVTNKKDSA